MTSIYTLDPNKLMRECKATVAVMFDDAEDIDRSDIRCAAMNVLTSLDIAPTSADEKEIELVCTYIRHSLRSPL